MTVSASLSAVVRITHADLGMVRTVEAAAAVAGDVVLVLRTPLDPRARPMIEGLARRHHAAIAFAAERAPEGAVRNIGVRATRGAGVLLLESGDRVEGAVLSALAGRIRDGAAVTAAPVRIERLDGATHVLAPPEPAAVALLTRPDAVPTAFVLSRRAFDAASGFDEALGGLADVDFWVRALAGGGVEIAGGAPLVTRPLAAAVTGAHTRAALEALYRKHAATLEADPARVLAALERHMAVLGTAHAPEAARRAAAIAELAALDAEIAALEGELRSLGRHTVDWGDFRRLSPVSREWGYDRGTPVDRPYIEDFLASHAGDVRGAVLEVQEADYTARFGGARVTRSEVVDVDDSNPRATVLADLRHADALASEAYDCFILTQTLHVVDDVRKALAEAYRVLKPGGVLLATFPSASRVAVEYGPEGDFWRVTEAGARELMAAAFPAEELTLHCYGNVMATTAFLHGLGAHELTRDEIAAYDPFHPLVIGVRARKPLAAAPDVARPVLARHTGLPRASGGAVLLYHRVADPARDVHGLCVPPAEFRTHLEMLRAAYEVVPLLELRRWIDAGRDPAGLVALTFDDGYLDNLALASPVLAEMELPATFFVTTEHLDRPGEFWWDTLERLLLADRPLPPALDLNGSLPPLRLDTSTAAARGQAHAALHHRLVGASLPERRAAMERILEWSGRPAAPAAARPLLAAEVRELASRPGHEIGGHGVHHLALTFQPEEVARREVNGATRCLGDVLGRPVTTFAYPYGDAGEAAVAAVRAAGLAIAVTCVEEPVRRGADPLRLPRIEVKAGPADALGERLWRLLR
jgi:peptidoglycan/xylan/chitin deacetylase (PgdA/CDA1 family)